MHHGVAGGLGSGLACGLIELIRQQFDGILIQSSAIYPDRCNPIESYNLILATEKLKSQCHSNIVFTNSGLSSWCHFNLGLSKPELKDLNSIYSQVLLGFFDSLSNSSHTLRKSSSILMPYPCVPFVLPTLTHSSPLSSFSSTAALTN